MVDKGREGVAFKVDLRLNKPRYIQIGATKKRVFSPGGFFKSIL